MDKIWDELCFGGYTAKPLAVSTAEKPLIDALTPYMDRVEEALGFQFVNELWLAAEAVSMQEQREVFREGVLLGLRLGRELN